MTDRTVRSGYIRKLWPSDEPAFRDHLLRLDAESRHDRFAMGVSDGFIRNYAERCFKLEGSIFGYFVEGELRGSGELRMIGDDHRVAEAAFSVEQDWRRQGVGRELMARIVRAARNARVETLYMSCLATNRAMQNLARHFEAELKFETDEVTGKLVGRRAPTAATHLEEIVEDATSFATAMVDLQRRTWLPRLGR
ncbi:MAG: GNAT family N-acetyltransferase [Beijerinckiaceae bacterium]|jgi:GNAT superfamily N-acetyltransferase